MLSHGELQLYRWFSVAHRDGRIWLYVFQCGYFQVTCLPSAACSGDAPSVEISRNPLDRADQLRPSSRASEL
ncbi:hypothetical protein AALO_G00103230 [Alosa alosa]|uniref:Uncharacterized protein n=1 Tax=Alosa alosa TaxID=278164 RepID=A0AAV6GUL9_9TELE|nr:hypothetical protein AALO_G00103230 [Alosa alosa]